MCSALCNRAEPWDDVSRAIAREPRASCIIAQLQYHGHPSERGVQFCTKFEKHSQSQFEEEEEEDDDDDHEDARSKLHILQLRRIAMAGSVKHILLLKFKASITPDHQASLIQEYAALPNAISAMKGFEWGTDMSVENMHQGFTHVFISTFDSSEGRDEYLVHPVHDAFGKKLLATLESVLVVDFKPTITLTSS